MSQPAITNVFVLMLENHSFDNVFGMSGISGITQPATTSDCNTDSATNQQYCAATPAPFSMPTDPGHEFGDVLEQLAGKGATYPSGGAYPSINNTGFVNNYATSDTEGTGLPTSTEVGDVMLCYNTPEQLPVIYKLATEFALCDQWYSAMPGPTWPNRFFVHGASSSGLDDSPTSTQMKEWIFGNLAGYGFTYPNGSAYDALNNQNVSYSLYIDTQGTLAGATPQVAAIQNVNYFDVYSLRGDEFSDGLASDLQNDYPYFYTFIEPNYGDIYSGKYTNGTCQHPMDSMEGGEGLIKYVYEAIRNSPLWETSLLIITYDEHGGFYDSTIPPGSVTGPNDGSNDSTNNQHGFTFEQLGVRVPAVIVSPLIVAGTVDHTTYDHSSVLATLWELLNTGSQAQPPVVSLSNQPITGLTDRDKQANTLTGLLTLETARTDCPTTLPDPASPSTGPTRAAAPEIDPATTPLPTSGNTQGFLHVLHKANLQVTHQELIAAQQQSAVAVTDADKQSASISLQQAQANYDQAQASVGQLKTLADAQAFSDMVQSRVAAHRVKRNLATRPANKLSFQEH